MKKKIKYTDEPMEIGEQMPDDFLPPPSKLVKREATAKITLELTKSSLEFFKQHAKKEHVPYQRMIRGLIDAYAKQQEART
jgi:predicted DNA binding CopG/RHH family protein